MYVKLQLHVRDLIGYVHGILLFVITLFVLRMWKFETVLGISLICKLHFHFCIFQLNNWFQFRITGKSHSSLWRLWYAEYVFTQEFSFEWFFAHRYTQHVTSFGSSTKRNQGKQLPLIRMEIGFIDLFAMWSSSAENQILWSSDAVNQLSKTTSSDYRVFDS